MPDRTFHIYYLLIFCSLLSCGRKNGHFVSSQVIHDQKIQPLSGHQTEYIPEIPLTCAHKKIRHQKIPSVTSINTASVKKNTNLEHETRVNPGVIYASPSPRQHLLLSTDLPVKEIVPEKEVNYFTLFLLAAFFPPLAVGIIKSFRSWYFFLTLGLTLTFFFPGMVYAIILMIREYSRDGR